MNIANKITLSRIFLSVIILVVLLFPWHQFGIDFPTYLVNGNMAIESKYIIVGILFIIASLTDFVDGHLARKNNIVSDYGKLMDPLADKLLVNTTIVSMMACGMYLIGSSSFLPLEILAMVASIVVIARDIFVDALRMQALKKNAVVAAGIWGKLKTATLMPGIVFMILGSLHPVVFAIGLSLMTLGGIFALIGGVKYYQALSIYIGD